MPIGRPGPNRQCVETAVTTGARCESWTLRDADRCSTHHRHAPNRIPAHRAVTASVASVSMDGVGWQEWRFSNRAWQREAWRLYDITGQLRFVGNWVGNSVSRCRLYVAEVDDAGEAGEETQDPEVAALAAGPLGQGPAKDEALRLLAIHLFVPGESYIVAEAEALDDGQDRWFVVSSRQIKRSGTQITIKRPQLHGGGDMIYRDGVDLILRVWTPHPADTDEPDSPTRSAIPDLREIEAIRKREFAELDSRLAGAGILPLPEGVDFPRGDNDPPGLPGFAQMLMRAMATSLQDRASAEAMVPLMITVPGDFVDKIKPVTFWSELSSQLLPMREAAIKSLAQSLDVPAEVLLGLSDTNHWCLSMDTEVYSEANGWVGLDSIQQGMRVLSLDHETGQTQWRAVTDIYQSDVTDEPLLSIESRYHSSLTTLGHKWPVLQPTRPRRRGSARRKLVWRQWATSADLLADQRSEPQRRHIILGAPSAEFETEAKYSDAFVTLMAWASTDADLTPIRAGTRRSLRIRQRNANSIARIRHCLTQMQVRYSERTDPGAGVTVFRLSTAATADLAQFGYVRGHRFVVDREVVGAFTESQLHLFLQVCVDANGHGRRVFAVDPSRLDPVGHAAIMLGYRVSWGRHARQTGFGDKPVSWVSWSTRSTFAPGPEHRSVVSYTGTVWCPTVEGNQTYLARRNGRTFYTGNSAWQISEDAVSTQIVPVLSRIADALTTGYLRGALEEMGKDPDGFVYAFDTAPLTTRPNRSADALNYFNAGLISEVAAVEAGAFREGQMPDDAERLRRLAERIILGAPSLATDPVLRKLVGIEVLPTAQQQPAVDGPVAEPIEPAETPQPRALPEQTPQTEDAAALMAVSNMAMLRALTLAGQRLVPHRLRDRYPDTPKHELHCRHGAIERQQAEVVLRGAWDDLSLVCQDLYVDAGQLQALLHGFAVELLTRGIAHDPGLLRDLLAAALGGARLVGAAA